MRAKFRLNQYPLIPANAGTQIVERRSFEIALKIEFLHLDPGIRRDERNNLNASI